MQSFIPMFIGIVAFVCAFGYMLYRNNVEKRAKEKKRNQYNDRV